MHFACCTYAAYVAWNKRADVCRVFLGHHTSGLRKNSNSVLGTARLDAVPNQSRERDRVPVGKCFPL